MSNSGESRAEPIVIAAPQWRGHLHRNGAILFPPFAAWLCFQANSARGLLCAILFGLAVEGIMSASAVLHTTQWRRTTRLNVARLIDYSMIFVGIAMLYSSLGVLLMGHSLIFWRLVCPLVWLAAALGVGGKVLSLESPRWVEAASFLSQGWACILAYRAIRATATVTEWRLLIGGGLSVSAGVVAYVTQWPKYQWHKKKFAAHELFHLGTMGMFGCFFALMYSLLRRV